MLILGKKLLLLIGFLLGCVCVGMDVVVMKEDMGLVGWEVVDGVRFCGMLEDCFVLFDVWGYVWC